MVRIFCLLWDDVVNILSGILFDFCWLFLVDLLNSLSGLLLRLLRDDGCSCDRGLNSLPHGGLSRFRVWVSEAPRLIDWRRLLFGFILLLRRLGRDLLGFVCSLLRLLLLFGGRRLQRIWLGFFHRSLVFDGWQHHLWLLRDRLSSDVGGLWKHWRN